MHRSSVWIDGALYCLGGMFIFSQGFLSEEGAYKYIDPHVLFWLKYWSGMGAAGAGALKAFRSMTFARHNGNMKDTTTNEKTNP